MDSDHDDDGPAQYSSPPCFMHELDPEFRATLSDWADVKRWRRAERERLIAARLAVSADARTAMSQRIGESLDAVIGDITGRMVSLYWPFRGEPDLRPWMASINERGGRTALPVVVEKGRPLIFRAYAPGDRLEKGVWNIPIPAEGDPVLPDIVISPIVGIRDSIGWAMVAAFSTARWRRCRSSRWSSVSATNCSVSPPSIRSRMTSRWTGW